MFLTILILGTIVWNLWFWLYSMPKQRDLMDTPAFGAGRRKAILLHFVDSVGIIFLTGFWTVYFINL